VNGNLLLTTLFGADVHLVETDEERQAIVERLRAEGHKVYNTSSDGYYLRSVSYVDGFIELSQQLQDRDVDIDGIYVPSGMHTHCGLSVGATALGSDVRIVGISMTPQDDAEEQGNLAATANKVAELLKLDLSFEAKDFETYGAYAGTAYGVPTPGGKEAIRLAAQYEGLVLELVYTGKAFAGMIDHIRKGQWDKGQTIVFVHTGGTPGLFAYAKEVLEA
jgi:1-aminocyclopropane-1-carboxylate deaminase/D-cysteine desulfhydrase-like pyridoxal-dependent ACC family enzyme